MHLDSPPPDSRRSSAGGSHSARTRALPFANASRVRTMPQIPAAGDVSPSPGSPLSHAATTRAHTPHDVMISASLSARQPRISAGASPLSTSTPRAVGWVIGTDTEAKKHLPMGARHQRHSLLLPADMDEEHVPERPAIVPPLSSASHALASAAAEDQGEEAGDHNDNREEGDERDEEEAGETAGEAADSMGSNDAAGEEADDAPTNEAHVLAEDANATPALAPAPPSVTEEDEGGYYDDDPGPGPHGATPQPPAPPPLPPPHATAAANARRSSTCAQPTSARSVPAARTSPRSPSAKPVPLLEGLSARRSDMFPLDGLPYHGRPSSSRPGNVPALALSDTPAQPAGGPADPRLPGVLPDGSLQSPVLTGLTLVELCEYKQKGFFSDAEFELIKSQLFKAIGS